MTTQEKRKRGRQAGSGEVILTQMQGIIEFIKHYSKENGIAPTLSEIAVGIGRPANDKPAVSNMVKVLVAEGFLENVGRFRSLKVAKHPPRRRYYP